MRLALIVATTSLALAQSTDRPTTAIRASQIGEECCTPDENVALAIY